MPIYPFINLFNAPNIMKNLITLPIKSKFCQDMGLDMFWVRFPWLPEADTNSFEQIFV